MNFENILKKSILDSDGKISSTRISAYIILLIIILFSISFLIVFTYILYTKGINNDMIIVFGMLLTHHLTLLGINKHIEKKTNK